MIGQLEILGSIEQHEDYGGKNNNIVLCFPKFEKVVTTLLSESCVLIWDVNTLRCLFDWKSYHIGNITDIMKWDDSHVISVCKEGVVQCMNIQKLERVFVLNIGRSIVNVLKLSDNEFLCFTHKDGVIISFSEKSVKKSIPLAGSSYYHTRIHQPILSSQKNSKEIIFIQKIINSYYRNITGTDICIYDIEKCEYVTRFDIEKVKDLDKSSSPEESIRQDASKKCEFYIDSNHNRILLFQIKKYRMVETETKPFCWRLYFYDVTNNLFYDSIDSPFIQNSELADAPHIKIINNILLFLRHDGHLRIFDVSSFKKPSKCEYVLRTSEIIPHPGVWKKLIRNFDCCQFGSDGLFFAIISGYSLDMVEIKGIPFVNVMDQEVFDENERVEFIRNLDDGLSVLFCLKIGDGEIMRFPKIFFL